MQAMCSSTNGDLVGWATAVVSCDGTDMTIEYFSTSGVSRGTTIPEEWTVCRPNFSSDSIVNIVQMTQAAYDALLTKDPNTLYIIVD